MAIYYGKLLSIMDNSIYNLNFMVQSKLLRQKNIMIKFKDN